MVAAGVGALRVDGTTLVALVEEEAAAVGATAQGIGGGAGVKMLNNPALGKLPGQQAWLLVKAEFVDHAQPHEIGGFDFHRQGAAHPGAMAAELGRKLGPGGGIVGIGIVPGKIDHGAAGWENDIGKGKRRGFTTCAQPTPEKR